MPWSTRFVLLLSWRLGGDEKRSYGTCLCGWAFCTWLYQWTHLGCMRLGHLGRQVVLQIPENVGEKGNKIKGN